MKNKKLFAILTLVCFMLTLMPVAAFAAAGDAKADMSYFTALDGDQTVTEKKAAEGITFVATIQDSNEDSTTASALYIWAKDGNGTVTSALDVDKANDVAKVDDVQYLTNVADGTKVKLFFARSGEYTVYAGLAKAGVGEVDSLSDINVFGEPSKIKVTGSTADPDTYKAALGQGEAMAIDEVIGSISLEPNNVMSDKLYVSFVDKDEKALRGKTVTISTNSGSIDTNKTTATTNSLGQIDFKVSASVEGNYEIEVSIDGASWTIAVAVGNTGATYIETVAQPTAPQALYGDLWNTAKTKTKVRFAITDINGNTVKAASDITKTPGMEKTLAAGNGKYIVLTEKPSASNLESEDLGLAYQTDDQQWYLTGISTLDAEGTYSVKVILDNGAYATATWEVKKFQTPVQLRIDTAVNTVSLGATINAELTYVDANGVEKLAKDATLAATGYAVANVKGWAVTAKTDEKYVGEKITVAAVSDKYNLVANKEYTVVGEAVAVTFADKTAEVNVNNKINWYLTDENGNKIAVASADKNQVTIKDIQYIILDKPENAKVSVTDNTNISDLKNKGIGKMSLTSNKVGNVAIQVVVKAEYAATTGNANQVKYYTGTQIFAVGNGSAGDVVVMSIGSNEIVINDKKATIDAAPIVQNDRTYVPFRALAEAFGAEVAYDEATQAVTAELNGVTVVMTIGSATYTVNGATADILFNL